MENLIAKLLQDFETGRIGRREFIQSIAVAASVSTSAPAATGFKTMAVDHISYQVADYKRTRDFYADLMGMTVSDDDGHQCQLHFGESMIIARNKPARTSPARVDHVAYRIRDWNTEKVKAELDRRKLQPHLDTGTGTTGLTNFASFHVKDPDGFDLQISGVTGPDDPLKRKR